MCTDRDAGYGNAVYAALPRVTVGVARFPGAQSDHDRVEQRRQQELQRLHQALPAAAYDPLQGVLGAFWGRYFLRVVALGRYKLYYSYSYRI